MSTEAAQSGKIEALRTRFVAAKASLEEANKGLKGILAEMVTEGMAKKIEDTGGDFPDMIIVAPKCLLDQIENYDFDENGSPSWLTADGEDITETADEHLEWF
jgi:hypothetical protein